MTSLHTRIGFVVFPLIGVIARAQASLQNRQSQIRRDPTGLLTDDVYLRHRAGVTDRPGGYRLDGLAESVVAHVKTLQGP